MFVAQASGNAPLGWDDVQLGVGLQQHVAFGLAEDDPLAVWRVLGKKVALVVVRCTLQWLRLSSLTVVEGDPIEIVTKGLLVDGKLGDVLPVDQSAVQLVEAFGMVRLRPSKDDFPFRRGSIPDWSARYCGSSAPGNAAKVFVCRS